MKLTTLKLTVVALGLFAYSQTSNAQDAQKKPDPEKMFKGLDANKDGVVSFEEFKNKKRKNEIPADRLEKMYARMDADSDGSVTMKEFRMNMEKGKGEGKPEGMKKKKKPETESEGEN